ncbi:MAG TPA: AMP-binding protein [Thermodesulfobacteriota bacterium]|nr:AMP-binding protein [Thermodesulfobacteriota bacterium]
MPKQGVMDRSSGFLKKHLETMPLEKRIAYLNQRLRGIIQHAYKNSVAVKNKMDSVGLKPKDIQTIKDLGKIPITKKADLVELQKKNPPFGGFEAVPIDTLRRIYVSPGPILEPGEAEYEDLGWAQAMYAAGFRRGDIVINTFSYHMVPFGMQMVDNSLRQAGCIVVPTGVGNTEQQVNIMKSLRVNGYCGTPSFLLNLAEKAEEMGLDCRKDLNLQVAFVAAEMLPESLRSKLEEKFGMTIRQSYGTADIGCLGYECREKNGMHIPDDRIVEIADPTTGKQLPPGKTGEIVGTTFNKVYPLVRFGTGDLSYLTDSPCPCRRTSPRLVKILGRVDQVTKVRGLFVHPGQADEVASKHPEIRKYQVVVTRKEHKDEMTFLIELQEENNQSDRLKEEIERSVRDVMKVRGGVKFVSKGTIPDKGKKIEDQRTWE